MTIITNNHKREIIYGYDLPEKVKSNFDWCDDIDSEQFVKYRDNYYALSEFVRLSKKRNINPWSPNVDPTLDRWDGIHSDSFFSAVLIRYDPEDSDYVVMGLYLA